MEVTDNMIQEWKAQHGSVYKIDPGVEIYYRTLTRADYINILQKQASGIEVDHEFETCKLCILNDVPDEVLEKKGGVCTVVYEQIMQNSGFVVVESEEL